LPQCSNCSPFLFFFYTIPKLNAEVQFRTASTCSLLESKNLKKRMTKFIIFYSIKNNKFR
jgi:hypothetical protein